MMVTPDRGKSMDIRIIAMPQLLLYTKKSRFGLVWKMLSKKSMSSQRGGKYRTDIVSRRYPPFNQSCASHNSPRP